MKKFILGLLLSFSISGMAFPVHHIHHHSRPHHSTHVTTHQTKKVQPYKVHRIVRHHNTKMINTYWRNGVLYYVILRPKKGYVYDNGLVLCEGCGKVLIKKNSKYCSKCRAKKQIRL